MVEFRCIGHDSRHVCRSVFVASGGFLFCRRWQIAFPPPSKSTGVILSHKVNKIKGL